MRVHSGFQEIVELIVCCIYLMDIVTKCVFVVSQNQSSIDVLPRNQYLIFHAVGNLFPFLSG